MREFKIRVWDLADKKMLSDKDLYAFSYGALKASRYIIMQYTGYNDGQYDEIYDRDRVVCRTYHGNASESKMGTIIVGIGYCNVVFDDNSEISFKDIIASNTDIQVTGNIYESAQEEAKVWIHDGIKARWATVSEYKKLLGED